jgi:hypothetical protein
MAKQRPARFKLSSAIRVRLKIMSRLHLKLFVVTLAFVVASLGIAAAALASLDDLAGVDLVPSVTPSLLGPITEVGRTGWDCAPEKAAMASRWHDAELPTTDR